MTTHIFPTIDREVHGGKHRLYFFDNNYGASVVSHRFSYGGSNGKCELAVLKYLGKGARDDYVNWELNYKTPITDDVIGWLDEAEVQGLLAQIKELPCSD